MCILGPSANFISTQMCTVDLYCLTHLNSFCFLTERKTYLPEAQLAEILEQSDFYATDDEQDYLP